MKIQPALGNLKYAKSKFPTPYGEFVVEHKVVGDRVITEINSPSEIEIIEN